VLGHDGRARTVVLTRAASEAAPPAGLLPEGSRESLGSAAGSEGGGDGLVGLGYTFQRPDGREGVVVKRLKDPSAGGPVGPGDRLLEIDGAPLGARLRSSELRRLVVGAPRSRAALLVERACGTRERVVVERRGAAGVNPETGPPSRDSAIPDDAPAVGRAVGLGLAFRDPDGRPGREVARVKPGSAAAGVVAAGDRVIRRPAPPRPAPGLVRAAAALPAKPASAARGLTAASVPGQHRRGGARGNVQRGAQGHGAPPTMPTKLPFRSAPPPYAHPSAVPTRDPRRCQVRGRPGDPALLVVRRGAAGGGALEHVTVYRVEDAGADAAGAEAEEVPGAAGVGGGGEAIVGLGMTFYRAERRAAGRVVKRVKPGSAAHRSGRIGAGDTVLSVRARPVRWPRPAARSVPACGCRRRPPVDLAHDALST